MPDPTSRIRFSSVFPKKAWVTLCRPDAGPIWMAWSGFGHMHLVQKQAGVQEPSGLVSGRTQPARYQFPTSRLGSVLPQTSRIILCKTSPDPIYFWLIVSGLGQTDPVRKQASVQESSGLLLANASQSIRTGYESDPACLLGFYFISTPSQPGRLEQGNKRKQTHTTQTRQLVLNCRQ